MNTEQWLNMLRRKLQDVDVQAARRTDNELLAVASDMAFEYSIREVQDFSNVTVTLGDDDTPGEIAGATDPVMMILLYAVALEVLSATYRNRVDRGELGVSWKSGLEEESTIQAEKAYKGMIGEVAAALEQLLLIYQRRTANGRPS